MKENDILIIDDDRDFLFILNELLKDKFTIRTATSARDGLLRIKEKLPHLIILDLYLPDMDGYQLTRYLRQGFTTRYIPIIIMSCEEKLDVEIEGFRLGIDEYIVKPPRVDELIAKIESILRRTYWNIDINPLTHLPGNNAIKEELKKRLQENQPFAAGYLDLDNFKAFNDKYGFARGDEAIKLLANSIISAIEHFGDITHDFVAHIGGDDFVFCISIDSVEAVCNSIIETFSSHIPFLYDEEDRKRGYIVTVNRKGLLEKFPIMSLSIGVADTKRYKLHHLAQIEDICNSLKEYAKLFPGSNWMVERRRNGGSTIIFPATSSVQFAEEENKWQRLSFLPELEKIRDIFSNFPYVYSACIPLGTILSKFRKELFVIFKEEVISFLKENLTEEPSNFIHFFDPKTQNLLILLPLYNIDELKELNLKFQQLLEIKLSSLLGDFCVASFLPLLACGHIVIQPLSGVRIEKQLYYILEKVEKEAENKYRLLKWQYLPQLNGMLSKLSVMFQPVMYIDTIVPLGYEALIRGTESPLLHPQLLLTLAEETNMVERLEEYAHTSIINKVADKLTSSKVLFLNLHPLTLGAPHVDRFNFPYLCWELSSDAVENYPILVEEAGKRLKERKIKLSFDKVKSVPSGEILKLWERLKPDFLKLDISLIKAAPQLQAVRKTIEALQEVANLWPCKLVALGIENEKELKIIQDLGINLAQGFLFAPPKPDLS
jgi:diguanylate cyclase (GGDEF)-like protein